jgi:hypothetical protein
MLGRVMRSDRTEAKSLSLTNRKSTRSNMPTPAKTARRITISDRGVTNEDGIVLHRLDNQTGEMS